MALIRKRPYRDQDQTNEVKRFECERLLYQFFLIVCWGSDNDSHSFRPVKCQLRMWKRIALIRKHHKFGQHDSTASRTTSFKLCLHGSARKAANLPVVDGSVTLRAALLRL